MAKYSHFKVIYTEARQGHQWARCLSRSHSDCGPELKCQPLQTVFIVHFTVFAWAPSQRKWAISLFYIYIYIQIYIFFTFAWQSVPKMSCSFYRPHLLWQGSAGGYRPVHSLSRKYAWKTRSQRRRGDRKSEPPLSGETALPFFILFSWSERSTYVWGEKLNKTTCWQFESAGYVCSQHGVCLDCRIKFGLVCCSLWLLLMFY